MMRYAGIDIASEQHCVAIMDAEQQLLLKPTTFTEDSEGYEKLVSLLGTPDDLVIVIEATGHYWKNVLAHLAGRGFRMALVNPLRTRRFAGEDLERTKTDAIDAVGIARFAAQKRPTPTALPDAMNDELRELIRHRDRLMQELGDHVRQLHRLVDLGFPEFTRFVRTLDSELATTLLAKYPNAEAFRKASAGKLANIKYDDRHHVVGRPLAKEILAAAQVSVGAFHGPAYRLQVKHACEDIDTLRKRLRALDSDVGHVVEGHDLAKLLVTIDGIGPTTAARIIGEVGDPARFKSAAALASYVGVVPALRHSGKYMPLRAGLTQIGNARLRAKLWMPVLVAVRKNSWLRAFYERLIAQGKLRKVALVAAMRKLLHAIYSVAKNRRPFEPRGLIAEATS